MFEVYKREVLKFYQEQKNKKVLSTELESPNRERLRKECIAVFTRKNTKADRDFVQAYFDPNRNYENQIRSIEKFKLDRFRSLVSFLTQTKEETRNIRSDKDVKLLAWILDFPSYEEWGNEHELSQKISSTAKDNITSVFEEKEANVGGDVDGLKANHSINNQTSKCDNTEIYLGGEKTDVGEEASVPVIESTEKGEAKKFFSPLKIDLDKNKQSPSKDFKWKGRVVIVGTGIILLGFVSFPRYMVWKENHYEFSFSGKDENNNLLPAADWGLIWNFKKIMRRDTLNESSIGKVWYLKENNDYEVFTKKGNHPVFVTRELRPMTQRVLDSIRVRVKTNKIVQSFKSE